MEKQRLTAQNKKLENDLKKRVCELQVLYDVSDAIGYALDYRKLVKLIMSSLNKVVDHDLSVSLLLNGESGDLTIQRIQPVTDDFINQAKSNVLTASNALMSWELSENNLKIEEALYDRWKAKGERLESEQIKTDVRSFFNVPLMIKDKFAGMINICSHKEDAFDVDDIKLLYTIANQMSIAIERVRGVIAAEKGKMEVMVDSMLDGVIMIDKDKKIAVINPAARRVLHLDSYQESGIDCEAINNLLGYDPTELLRKAGKSSMENKVSIYQVPYQVQASSVLGSEGELLGTVVNLRDISKEKEIDRRKSEFISIVGHELRTPLTSIKNAVNIIFSKKAGDINENQMRFLSMADRNINRLSDIINDLLDISKIESGRIKIESKSMDLHDSLDMAISSLAPGAMEKSVSIRKEIPSDLPQAYGDSDKLEQIFINLLSNAIKFTPEGGRICVSASEVQGEDFIEISVTDTGIGIAPDEIEKVFDRFYQVEEALTRGIQGTGLGLSIVKGLVKAHRGKIWAESEVGKGAKFVFTLPGYSVDRALRERLDREIEVAREKGIPLSLITLKIEEFEYLNKAYGEAEVLHMLDDFKQIIQNTALRSTDKLQIEVGGGVMILPDTSKEGVVALGIRLKDAFSRQTFEMKQSVRITVATGVATYPDDGVTREELMKKAQSESS